MKAHVPGVLLAVSTLALPAIGQGTTFEPWIYQNGTRLHGDNLWKEETANTVFVLARDLVTLPTQNGTRDEVLLCNFAQFSPPEHVAATQRVLEPASITHRGLQLYVNYSGSQIDPVLGFQYEEGTFFVSLPEPIENAQTDPPVTPHAISGVTMSATRAAFGMVRLGVTVIQGGHGGGGLGGGTAIQLGDPELALYVTAGTSFAESEVDFGYFSVDEVVGDRLFVLHNGVWQDHSDIVPASVRAGNDAGVAFADFNGDGYQDLYVGAQGDNYTGEEDALLIFDPTTGLFDLENHRILGAVYEGATTDVAAGDVDLDGDQDIVVVSRKPRLGHTTTTDRARDFVLRNDSGTFTRIFLEAEGAGRGSGSVALGNLGDPNGSGTDLRPEIVVANAGQYIHELAPYAYFFSHEATQIWTSSGSGSGLAFTDITSTFLGGLESGLTIPFCVQILLEDFAGPSSFEPDGWLDLWFVNRTESLKHNLALSQGPLHWVIGGKNMQNGTAGVLHKIGTVGTQTACLGEFARAPDEESAGRDLFVGTGNVWSGLVSGLHRRNAVGNFTAIDFDTTYDRLPGNERGYGFDFAHVGGTGGMDGIQTSRGYNYLIDGIGQSSHNAPWHWQLTASTSPKKLEYRRGRSWPLGGEDGVFADFDGDGDLDALVAQHKFPSATHPFKATSDPLDEYSAPAAFLWQDIGTGPSLNESFTHDAQVLTLVSYDPAVTPQPVLVDARIDASARDGYPYPPLGDRAVAGDLDNDGDTDALVQYQPSNSPLPYVPTTDKFSAPGDPTPEPASSFTVGWSYLMNKGPAQPGYFADVAGTKMKDRFGAFSKFWHRALGATVLADFDNDGALDVYTSAGSILDALDGLGNYTDSLMEAKAQLKDLVFFNGPGALPVGTFLDVTNQVLANQGFWPDVAQPTGDGLAHDVAGSFGLAQGDLDNDGFADVMVFHGAPNYPVARYPSMLVNDIAGTGKFIEEFTTRVPVGSLDAEIYTPPVPLYAGGTAPGMDHAMFGGFLDFDADGDLDLVYSVMNDLPRMLRNTGADSNADGVIDGNDTTPPGTFEDVTAELLTLRKPTTDAQDFQVVDLDDDGDLDFGIDAFNDIPFFYRNLTPLSSRPAVTEAWPRVGQTRNRSVKLHGVNLSTVDTVELRFASGIQTITGTALSTCTAPGNVECLEVALPATGPKGLAQVRVRTSGGVWSTLYFGYFVQG